MKSIPTDMLRHTIAALLKMRDVPSFYRMLPSSFYSTLDISKIPMPFWSKAQHAEERAKEQNCVENLTTRFTAQIAQDPEAGAAQEEPPAAA